MANLIERHIKSKINSSLLLNY